MFLLLSICQAAEHYNGWSYYLGDPHSHTGLSGDGSFYDPESCATCSRREDIFQRARNNGSCENLRIWAASLSDRFGPMLLMPHHPGVMRPSPVEWECQHSAYEPVVEVYSQHGNSMYDEFARDPPATGVVPEGSVEAALDPDRFGLKTALQQARTATTATPEMPVVWTRSGLCQRPEGVDRGGAPRDRDAESRLALCGLSASFHLCHHRPDDADTGGVRKPGI